MANELVITSVRKGLDGGAGYQPVLRTKGMKTAVAERLRIRSGYPHPFPHGDHRNPVVFVHRVEQVAGETLHVLARICDAGSDHTGRSNFLAHLVTLDDAEARRKPAGPAEVMRRMAFKTSWAEPAREADAPTVIGGDRQPASCGAWRSAGLDPGLAGDLAEAAMQGRSVTVIAREQDDVLALFADALALVSPAQRWQVTFNTCEIEPFDALWRATRTDLAQAKVARAGAGVIDLTMSGLRGSDGAYARFARGEADWLPWQQSTKLANAPAHGGSTRGRSTEPVPAVDRTSGRDAARVPERVAAPGAPPTWRLRPTVAGKGGRGTGRRWNGGDDEVTVRKAGWSAADVTLWFLGITLVIVSLGGAAAVSLSPQLRRTLFSARQVAVAPTPPAGDETNGRDFDEEEHRKKREREAKRAEEARLREQEEEKKRAEEADERERQRMQTEAAENVQKEQAARKRVEDAKNDRERRQQEAFVALRRMPECVGQDLVPPNGFSEGPPPVVDLGAFAVDALLDVGFDLAVPKGLNAWVEEKDPSAPIPTWKISVEGGDRPIHIATLEARDGRLAITAANKNVINYPKFRMLRRSVLLVEARDPASQDSPAKVQRQIQLVQIFEQPMTLSISPLGETKELKLKAPRGLGIASKPGADPPALPADCELSLDVHFDYPLKGGGKSPQTYKGTLGPAGEEREPEHRFFKLLSCPEDKEHPAADVGLEVRLSLQGGMIRVRPCIEGQGKHAWNLELLKSRVEMKDDAFDQWKKQQVGFVQGPVNMACKPPVERFINSSTNIQSLYDALRKSPEAHKHLQEFLDKRFPPGGEKDKRDPFERWQHEWLEIARKATAIAAETSGRAKQEIEAAMRGPRQEWEHVFKGTLQDWMTEYQRLVTEKVEQERKAFAPLRSNATVVVTEITCRAIGPDGTAHTVVLARPKSERTDTPECDVKPRTQSNFE